MTTETAVRATQVKQGVERILNQYPETRDNDKVLMVRYWADIEGLVFDYSFPTRLITEGTSPESITRARRAIQQAGLYLPSTEATLRRRQRQAEMREHFATT